MGKYNFDKWIERTGTNCVKYDFAKESGYSGEELSLWVADMDFETVPEITDALVERAKHGIYGYSMPKKDYWDTVTSYMENEHNYKTKREWYLNAPGIVFALAMAIRAITKEGDSVIIQRPVYHPFTRMVEANNRKLINSPLKEVMLNGTIHYEMDLKDFEEKIQLHNVKLFILCNPHNPVGRVWTRDELISIGEICRKYGVVVVSDEIHFDFVYPGFKHTCFASISKEFGNMTISCTSPTKTFNLAGLQISNVIIENEEIREKVIEEIKSVGYDEPNIFGMIACKAAYEFGKPWLEELNEYLLGNLNYVREFLKKHLPKISLIEPEGTYLIWLDFRAYQLTKEELEQKIVKEAKLRLNVGGMFGEEGEGFERVNLATPRAYLEKAMKQLEQVFVDLR
ncbi:MalY/PatB family protein [Lachnoclostridium sp.]|uniref:MalY/PatB family protein n=1 Tax=Lachnoclostridium sp. TaxID=2028282 RepID=UPI00289CF527|nr:MalY/PatB family protein [Lachnoclostridium sp.]